MYLYSLSHDTAKAHYTGQTKFQSSMRSRAGTRIYVRMRIVAFNTNKPCPAGTNNHLATISR